MTGLSRWLKWAGQLTRQQYRKLNKRKNPTSRSFGFGRTILALEELEERVVPSMLGQQLFPADYPWNQNIANAPVAANSAAVIAHIGSANLHPDWGNDSASNGASPLYGIPYNVVHGNSPSVTKINVIIDISYPGESNVVVVPMPANPVVIEGRLSKTDRTRMAADTSPANAAIRI